MTTSFAIGEDVIILGNLEFGFGVLARLTEDELVDKGVEEVSHTVLIVSSVDDVSFRLVVEGSLSSEFTSEELGRVYRDSNVVSLRVLSVSANPEGEREKEMKTHRTKDGSKLLRHRPCWGRLRSRKRVV